MTIDERIILEKEIYNLQEKYEHVQGTKCEVWSRIVGYFRPVKDWNEGKFEEYKDRIEYEINN